MKQRREERASQRDEDSPEWTRDQIKNARPTLEVVEEIFGKRGVCDWARAELEEETNS